MDARQSIIVDLEDAIRVSSMDRRVGTLRRITDYFLQNAERLNESHVEVFDDVLCQLVLGVEAKILAEVSGQLGPIGNAPVKTSRYLANDDDIAVAEPVLAHSVRLGTGDLLEISQTKSQAHLLAISARRDLETSVTDVLLGRGDKNVVHRLADNEGARFSGTGYVILTRHSHTDEKLAEKVAIRADLPMTLRHQLVLRASGSARSRLLSIAGPESRDQIKRILASVPEQPSAKVPVLRANHAEAQRLVLDMYSKGHLGEPAILDFAATNKLSELLATLALFSSAPFSLVANILQSDTQDAILIPCRAAGFRWATVRAILACIGRSQGRAMTDQELTQLRNSYSALTKSSAQRVLQFWRTRQKGPVNKPGKSSSFRQVVTRELQQ